MSSLYQLGKQYETVIEGGFVFDEETGEIIWDSENLDDLREALEDKLEACGLYLKNLNAEAKAIREEEKALAERRKTVERKAERMNAYVLDCLLDKIEGHKLSTPRIALSTRKSKRVGITDESAIPDDFTTVKTTIAPDKAKIKKAIEAGERVPGACIIEDYNLQVK